MSAWIISSFDFSSVTGCIFKLIGVGNFSSLSLSIFVTVSEPLCNLIFLDFFSFLGLSVHGCPPQAFPYNEESFPLDADTPNFA